MKRFLSVWLLLACVGIVAVACARTKGQEHPGAFEQEKFRNPENTYRAVPFYSLNDRLEAEELKRQIGIFHQAGYGGAFLHSRIGLLTPYLSEEWFHMMAVGTKALQDLGMEAWYYDEDKWPSGFAGGIIPRMNDDFRARFILRMVKDQTVLPPDEVLWEDDHYKYVCAVDSMGDPWFNGTSWVDLMNPEMVRAFIDISYVPYVERFGGQPNVMGMFTDEPQIRPWTNTPNEGIVSYSPVMDTAFKRLWGYDLHPVIPALFDTVGDWRKIRVHYYRTVAYCMETAFSKQIGDYCAANGFIFTGHYNAEEHPTANTLNEGNLMQQLRHQQRPGIDALGLHYNPVHTGKVASSVANQYGLTRRLSELFGISGHNMTFEDRMWITGWHTLMGINFMCPHLYLYSMKGERKRDYPPALSHQQPYFGYNKLFEDYSARLCYFATAGKTAAEVLVLHPLESAHIEMELGTSHERDQRYETLLNALMETHRNSDMGDEQIISEIGSVQDGRFIVGEMAYRLVVIPDMLTIRQTTLDLLHEFHKAGGHMLLCGDYPAYVDGESKPDAIAALKNIVTPVTLDNLSASIHRSASPEFEVTGDGSTKIWTHLREVSNGRTIQLSNTKRDESLRVQLRLADAGAPVALWNPVDGSCLEMTADAPGVYTLEFAPAQTWIVSTGRSAEQAIFDAKYELPGERTRFMTVENVWSGRRLDPNAIQLDYARFSKDGGKSWSVSEPVLAFSDRSAWLKPYNGKLSIKYEVDIMKVPTHAELVLEQPDMYEGITVNGQPVVYDTPDFYLDKEFRRQDVTPLLKNGNNEIVLTLDYRSAVPTSFDAVERYGTEIEAVMLIGDFAVRGQQEEFPLADTWRNRHKGLHKRPAVNRFRSFVITGEDETFTGNLTLEGYPFYGGSFELTQELEAGPLDPDAKYLLSFPEFESILIGVSLNGKAYPVLFASPWEIDVTGNLKTGRNELKITLVNGLRNLMGPHHHKGGELYEVGPATFRANNEWPNLIEKGENNWYDARLDVTANLWRDAYHFIPFGLLQSPAILEETR